jgi:hypothetical protein
MNENIKEIIAETRRLEKEATPADQFTMEIVQGDCIHRKNPGSRQVLNTNKAWLVSHDHRAAHKLRADSDFIVYARNHITAILDYVGELENINAWLAQEKSALNKKVNDLSCGSSSGTKDDL